MSFAVGEGREVHFFDAYYAVWAEMIIFAGFISPLGVCYPWGENFCGNN